MPVVAIFSVWVWRFSAIKSPVGRIRQVKGRAQRPVLLCHNSFPARPGILVVLQHLAVSRFTRGQVLNRIGIGCIVGVVSVLAGLAVGHHTEAGSRTIGENGFNRIISVGLPESVRRRMGSSIEP